MKDQGFRASNGHVYIRHVTQKLVYIPSQLQYLYHNEMAYFNNKIHTLEQLEELYWEMNTPKFFSFCGLLESIDVVDEARNVVSKVSSPLDILSSIFIKFHFRTKSGCTLDRESIL